jgi:predicted ATPase
MGMSLKGCLFALNGRASEAIDIIASGLAAYRSTGTTVWMPLHLSSLARAHADIGQFDDARRTISDAMIVVETTNERWLEAETSRIAGEIALKSPEHEAAKAENYFERALAVARQQRARSWELRAAMSLARLWRDQARSRKPANCWLRLTGGSQKGSTRATWRMRRRRSISWRDAEPR